MTDYQAKRDAFLSLFPTNRRSKVTNDFLYVIRGQGLEDPRLICREVYLKVQAQMLRQQPELMDILETMRNNRQAAMDFAEWGVYWETLTDEQKKRARNAGNEHYQQEWMATQQPTGRQLALLDSFGYQGTVDNRLHASQLIDEYINLRQDYKHRGKQ